MFSKIYFKVFFKKCCSVPQHKKTLDFIFKDKKIIISLETHLAMNKDSNVLDKEKYFVDNIRRIKEYDV